jgi:hypothetical protein
MQLELTTDEASLLAELVDSALGETREQIYKAEVADYKAALRQRETLLAQLLERLGQKQPTVG